MDFANLLWWIFAGVATVAGIGMVVMKNPVGSLLSLVVSFFGLAAIYVLLGAEFVAAIQVILYAGAIMVLFLFVIMLLNLGHDYKRDLQSVMWIAISGAASGVVGWLIAREFVVSWPDAGAGAGAAITAANQELGAVGAIAFPLFREYLVPFELTSILLLVAVIGAVLLAKRRI